MSEINSFYRRPWRSLGSSLNEPVWWKALTECLANVNREITDDRGTANSERPCQKKKTPTRGRYCRSSCALSYVPFLVGLSLWQLIWILNNWSEIDVLYGCNSSHSLRWCLFCALMCSLRYVYAQNSKQIILSHHLLRKYPLEGIQGGGCANTDNHKWQYVLLRTENALLLKYRKHNHAYRNFPEFVYSRLYPYTDRQRRLKHICGYNNGYLKAQLNSCQLTKTDIQRRLRQTCAHLCYLTAALLFIKTVCCSPLDSFAGVYFILFCFIYFFFKRRHRVTNWWFISDRKWVRSTKIILSHCPCITAVRL